MIIKAGIWRNLNTKQKLDLLVHYSFYNQKKRAQ